MAHRAALTIAIIGAWILTSVRVSWAQAPARVSVVTQRCDDAFDSRELERLVRIELASEGVEEVLFEQSPAALAVIRIEVASCSKNVAEIALILDDRATAKSVRRAMAVTDVARASRPRALALAVSELLRASWAELAMPDAPTASDVVVPPSIVRAVKLRTATPARVEAPRVVAPPRFQVRAGLESRAFLSYDSVVLGPTLGLSIPLGSLPLRIRADGRVGFGSVYDPLGTIQLRLVTGDVGLMLYGGPQSARFELGPMLSLGQGYARGAPSTSNVGTSGEALFAAAVLAAGASIEIAPRWWGFLNAEVGGVLQSFDAQSSGRTVTGFGGSTFALSLGLSREF